MTTILFAGSQITDFTQTTNATETTTSADTSWVPAAVGTYSSSVPMLATLESSASSLWTHFRVGSDNSDSGGKVAELQDSSGVARVRLYYTATSMLSMQYYNGSAWITVGTVAFGTATGQIDMKVTPTELAFVLDRAIIATVSGDFSVIGAVTQLALYGANNQQSRFSEVIVATTSTVMMRYKLVNAGANGTHADWTGSYADVDEAIYSTTDYISAASAGLVSTFTASARDFTGYSVAAVVVSIPGLRDTDGPTGVQSVLRIGGTDYFSATRALASGYGAIRVMYHTSPATGAAFTTTEAGAATTEFGVKSIA